MICLAIKYWFYQLRLIFLSYIYIYFTFLIQLFIAFSLLSRQSPRSRASKENTLREFPPVIATVAKVSRKRGLWLVVRVN